MRLQLLEDADSCSTQFRFERIEGQKRREMGKTEQYNTVAEVSSMPETVIGFQRTRGQTIESGQPETRVIETFFVSMTLQRRTN